MDEQNCCNEKFVIANNVISEIIKQEIYSMGDISNKIKLESKKIKTEVKDNLVTASISIDVLYGIKIPELCKKIQIDVAKIIKIMTELDVKAININIQNVFIYKNK